MRLYPKYHMVAMNQSFQSYQSQKQQQGLHHVQTLRIVQMSTKELIESIQTELNTNPALEIDPTKNKSSFYRDEHGNIVSHEEPQHKISFQGSLPTESMPDQFANIPQEQDGESLHDHLMFQIELCQFTPKEKRLATIVIENLDENGFHILPPHHIAAGYSRDIVDRVLNALQSLDPVGIAVTNTIESLIVQAHQTEQCPEHFDAFLRSLFSTESTQSNTPSRLSLSETEKTQYMTFLRTLHPFPGKLFSSKKVHYIKPDAKIIIDKETVSIEFTTHNAPPIRINPKYQEMLEKKHTSIDDEETQNTSLDRKSVRSYIRKGEQFLTILALREKTNERIITRIIEHQTAYFLHGLRHLKVLKMYVLADELQLSTSTISRIANTRYVQTPTGIHSLRFFFSLGTNTPHKAISRAAIKDEIRLILEKNEKRPSDETIRIHLEQKDIFIARRTVAKYRKELNV